MNTFLANWETEVLVTAEAPFGIGVPVAVDQESSEETDSETAAD